MNFNEIVCKNFIKNDTGYVHFAGYNRSMSKPANREMRILGSFAIAYLINGGGKYEDATGFSTTLSPGDLIFVDAKLPHRYGPSDNQNWEEIFFVFGGDAIEKVATFNLITENHRIGKLLPIGLYKKKALELMTHLQNADPNDTFWLLSNLQLLIAEAFKDPRHKSIKESKLIYEAADYIRKNSNSGIDHTDLAQQLNIPYESFRKKFKRELGFSPNQYKNIALMEVACNLLLTTKKSIKDIAIELNFCNEFHFSQQFKKTQGVSPKTYRKQMPSKNQ